MWWMVFEQKGGRYVWIEEGSNIMSARLKASMAGHTDGFLEAHQLTDKMISKVPKSLVHKQLGMEEAAKLLERLG